MLRYRRRFQFFSLLINFFPKIILQKERLALLDNSLVWLHTGYTQCHLNKTISYGCKGSGVNNNAQVRRKNKQNATNGLGRGYRSGVYLGAKVLVVSFDLGTGSLSGFCGPEIPG